MKNNTSAIDESIILGGSTPQTEPAEKKVLKLSHKTVWENLEDALSIYMANKSAPYPITAGEWTIKEATQNSLSFMLYYNDFRCFSVEFKGNKTYHIGSKLEHDTKNYLGIGKKVVLLLQDKGYTVDNAIAFTAKN